MKVTLTEQVLEAVLSGRRVVVANGVPERGMRTLSILCAFTLLCPAKTWADPLGDPSPETGPSAVQPAYRFVEGISDSVYDFTRAHVLGTLLPGRLSSGLKAAPDRDSGDLFDRTLRENESRFFERARQAYPAQQTGLGEPVAQGRLDAWRSWMLQEQASVALNSFGKTMIKRYQLELFGDFSGRYASNRRNWDPGLAATAGVVGGAFLYLGGIHTHFDVGRLDVGVDLSPGLRFQHAVQRGDDVQRLGGVKLSLKGVPLTVSTDWGISQRRAKADRVSVDYKLRF